MNILVLVSHHDDLKLGCGGAVEKFVNACHIVYCLVMNNSEYRSSENVLIKKKEDAITGTNAAS